MKDGKVLELLMIYKLVITICLLHCENIVFDYEYKTLFQCERHIPNMGFKKEWYPRCIVLKK